MNFVKISKKIVYFNLKNNPKPLCFRDIFSLTKNLLKNYMRA
ncbi:hypothetical protein EV142_103160 [Flavobacterium circumlabens]|uniref:Uncharacterized protein n=1 Tax=Flavobacterium circumlabens TaxID=2133765 RepID=A0ABY2AZG8_9FLAO|nr:hypothetical protein EV142_103160 [Flavobacterium circumlabens]